MQSTLALPCAGLLCGASARCANSSLRFSGQSHAMSRFQPRRFAGLAMHCATAALSNVYPFMEWRFVGFGVPVRAVPIFCSIQSSPQQPIFLPLFRVVWSANALTKAAAGCFWTVPTPAKGAGAPWQTAAIETKLGNTIDVRPACSRNQATGNATGPFSGDAYFESSGNASSRPPRAPGFLSFTSPHDDRVEGSPISALGSVSLSLTTREGHPPHRGSRPFDLCRE